MSSEIREYLNRLDLTSTEIDIYLSLIKLGPSSILDISRISKIKRSTVHFAVENLINKGFVYETKSKRKRLLVSEDPAKIKLILNEKLREIEQLKIEVDKTIRSIKKISNNKKDFCKSEFSYYKGLDSVSNVYKEILKANSMFTFSNLDRYYRVYPESRNLFIKALNKNHKRMVKTIAVDSYLARQIEKTKSSNNYQSKFISKEFFDNADINIYDGNVAVITLDKNPSAVIIKSDIITTAFMGIHNVLWSVL